MKTETQGERFMAVNAQWRIFFKRPCMVGGLAGIQTRGVQPLDRPSLWDVVYLRVFPLRHFVRDRGTVYT